MKTPAALTLIALTLTLLTACSTPAPVPTTPADITSKTLSNYTVTSNMSEEPQITIVKNENSIKNVMVETITSGEGQKITSNDTITFHVKTLGAKKGTIVENTWETGEPETAKISNLTQGLQQGLIGMAEGSRRLIVVPAKQAYGMNPPEGSLITPRESLIYIVDLKEIKK